VFVVRSRVQVVHLVEFLVLIESLNQRCLPWVLVM